MRIGIYDPYLDDLGGGEKYMMTAAEYLSQNHDVTVFWDNKDDLDKLRERFSLNLGRAKIAKNIFSPSISLAERLVVTRNFDALLILIDGSIPFVSSRKLFLHIQQPLGGIKSISWKSKLKLSRVSGIFYNSKFTKAFNDRIFTNVTSTVIYPPVDILIKNLVKENLILHVGRFRVVSVRNEDYKKQFVMIDAFKKMVDEGLKSWKFILATSINDENDPKFKEMIKSTKGYPIELLVNKNNAELWETYNKAKIYWHASGYGEDIEKHPEYAEHFGISTVEAMGAGAVPVVINAGGQKEIVTNKISGFLWNDLDELINETKMLINDGELWKKMSAGAKIRAKDFSVGKFGTELEKMIV